MGAAVDSNGTPSSEWIYINSDQTNWQWNSSPNPPMLQTIRTYRDDMPWQFNVSKFIKQYADPFLNADQHQASIDIQSINFNMTFINYQPDVDMRFRIMLVRQVREETALDQDSHSDKLPDWWQDPVDKHERHHFDKAFNEADFDVNFKDYAPPSKRWKIWKQTVFTVRSNPHVNEITRNVADPADGRHNQILATAQNADSGMVQNKYIPTANFNNGNENPNFRYDMNVGRIRGYPGQNEKKILFNWIPKGGYRYQFIDPDTTAVGELNQKVPKDDLRLIIMPFEETKDVLRKSTQHRIGYRFQAMIKFKDLL
jgi:hypothetical protein